MSNCYNYSVKLIGKFKIDEFKQFHSTSCKAFEHWEKLIEGANLNTLQDLKNLFGFNIDFIGSQTVFDIGGNKVRAIIKIEPGVKIILITHVVTQSLME